MKEILLLACEIGLPNNDIRDIDEYIDHNEYTSTVICSNFSQSIRASGYQF